MTPQEALQLVDSIVSQVSMAREGHAQSQEAMRVIMVSLNEGIEDKKVITTLEETIKDLEGGKDE